MSDMKNRVAIVTGASRGIGAAIAERLGRDGFTVIVNYVGNAAMANAVVARIEAAGGVALSAQADVADPVAVKKMFDAAETAFGGVDVLINNAGIMSLSPLAATEDLDFDKTVSVNLKGTFNTMRGGRQAPARQWTHYQFFHQCGWPETGKLRYLCSDQGRRPNADGYHGQGNARSKHHRQCRRPRPHRDRPLSGWKIRGTGCSHGEDEPARTARHTGGHRRRSGVSRGTRRRLGERPDLTRQWWDHLKYGHVLRGRYLVERISPKTILIVVDNPYSP